MKKGSHMTEESKKKLSESIAAAYKKRGNYGHYGVHQKDDEVSYRTYQREYKREWYKKNYEKWHEYTMKKNYEKMTTEKLLKLKANHEKGFFRNPEKKQRLINLIDAVLIERGAVQPVVDFEHNYSVVTIPESAANTFNCAPNITVEIDKPKPNKIEINGVWYDLVESPIQWEG
mgnify:CR=1 FL=1